MSALLSAITDKSTIHSVHCAIMRGGTSKAIVFAAADLPADPRSRDQLILAAFGSPDPRQIDGLGGADPLTSKVAIVARSTRPGHDVDYTFGQVGIAAATVNYAVSCGNTAAAVALYAIQERLVQATNGPARVRIHCINNGKQIVTPVSTHQWPADGQPRCTRAGRPESRRTGQSRIHRPGRRRHRPPAPIRSSPGRDAYDPRHRRAVFARRLRQPVRNHPGSHLGAQRLRRACANSSWLRVSGTKSRRSASRSPSVNCRMRIAATRQAARAARLKIAIVGSPAGRFAEVATGARRAIDIVARIVNPERVHKAFAVTGAMCLTAAAGVPGHGRGRPRVATADGWTRRVPHPSSPGRHCVRDSTACGRRAAPTIHSIRDRPNARRIMDGYVYVSDKEPVPVTIAAEQKVAGPHS